MSHAVRVARRALPVLVAAALAATLPGGGTALAGASSDPPKYYAASPALTAAEPGASVTLTLTNCGNGTCGGHSSLQSFGSAQLSVPATAGIDLSAVTTDRGWAVQGPVTTGEVTSVTVLAGTAAPPVAPGEALRVTFGVRPDATAGDVTVSTRVKQSNDFNGDGNDFSLTTAQPVVRITPAPAVDLRFAGGPSDVQAAGSAETAPGVEPVRTMCPPVVVQLVDADGNVATGEPDTVVTLSAPGAGLRVGGSTSLTRTAVDGVAVFGAQPGADGTCADADGAVSATTVGVGYQMSASAELSVGTRTATADERFDVVPVYGRCAGDCSTPTLQDERGDTSAQVTATDTGSTPGVADLLSFSVDLDSNADLLAFCDPDPGATGTNPYRRPVTMDLAGHDKSVALRWSKKAVQWATNNGASQWRVCLAAEASFAALRDDGSVGPAVQVGDWYVGALLPCGDPALASTDPCLARLGRNGGEQVATVRVPDRPGDPRMY